MAGMLELLEQGYIKKRTMVNMGKVDNMQEQLDKVSRNMQFLRKNQKEMLEIKKKKKKSNRNAKCL